MTDTDLLGPGSGDEPTPDDREALAEVLLEHRAAEFIQTSKSKWWWRCVGCYRPLFGSDYASDTPQSVQCALADHQADAIIAAGFRRHPEPVKPTWESVWQAWHGTEEPWGGCADAESVGRVLDLWSPEPVKPSRNEGEMLRGWDLDDRDVEAIRGAAIDAAAWALLERTCDLTIHEPSAGAVNDARSAVLALWPGRSVAEGGGERG